MASHGPPQTPFSEESHANCLLIKTVEEIHTQWSEVVCPWSQLEDEGLRYLPWPLDYIFVSLP